MNDTTRLAFPNHQLRPATCRTTGVNSPDRVYAFDVPGGRTVSVVLTPAGQPPWDAVINLVTSPTFCGAPGAPSMSCVAAADDPERLSYFNPSMVTQRVYLVVSGFVASAQGDFTLSVAFNEGERCESAKPLLANTVVANESLAGFSNDYQGVGSGCAPRSFGPDRVYTVTVPPGSELAVQVTPAGLDTNVSFASVASQCAPRMCTGLTGDTPGIGAPDRGTFQNPGFTNVDLLVIVDSATANGAGTFTIQTSTAPLSMLGDTCQAPLQIAPNSFLPNQSLFGFSDNYVSSMTCDYRPGPDRVYAVTVPPFSELTVVLTPQFIGVDFGLSVAADAFACTLGSCFDRAPPSPMGRRLVVRNAFATSTQSLLIVEGSPGNIYSLSTSVAPIGFDGGVLDAGVADAGTPTLGETCSNPSVLSPGATLMVPLNVSTNDTPAVAPTCVFGPGPDRMFTVVVPAQQRVTVTATPFSPFDVMLSMADPASCQAGACFAAQNTVGIGGAESLTFANSSMASRVLTLILDSVGFPAGTVQLTATLSPLNQAGDTCLNAIPIAVQQTLTGRTTVGLTKDYDHQGPGCISPLGPEAVYAVSLAANQRLTVVASSNQDLAINVVSGPAASCSSVMSCLVGEDMGGTGTETAIFDNGPLPQTVYVVIAAWGSTTNTLQSYDVSFFMSFLPDAGP